MNEPINFFVPGDPVALKRHRSVRIGTFTRQYDPSAGDKGDFLAKAIAHRPSIPYSGALSVRLTFLFSRPKGHYGSGKNNGLVKSSAPQYHTGKPDADNLAKFVGDALNGIFWKDDSCIAQMLIIKLFTSDTPGVLVQVEQIA